MRTEFRRVDLTVTIARSDERQGVAHFVVGGETPRMARFDPAQLVEPNGTHPLPDEFETELRQALASWTTEQGRFDSGPNILIPRIALDIRDPEFASVPFERMFSSLLEPSPYAVVVRTTPVRAHVAATPLTLPIRFLELSPRAGREAIKAVLSVFGGHLSARATKAVEVAPGSPASINELRQQLDWPTADVVHFGNYPLANPERLLSTASRDEVGTLGWLSRLTDTWQMRLVVIDCETSERSALVRLAEGLAARGGPALLVTSSDDTLDIDRFYELVIHDFPLDDAVRQASGSIQSSDAPPALIVGAGREELLRPSSVALGLLDLTHEIDRYLKTGSSSVAEDIAALTTRGPTEVHAVHRHLMTNVEHQWNTWEFEFHESEGVIPTGLALDELRAMVGATRQPPPVRGEGTRFINSHLAFLDETGSLRRVTQSGASLQVGTTYHLAIQIGPRDTTIRVFGATALVEEVFKWGPEVAGRWLEVGVTGIDFDVVGDPVQDLFLPREGASEEIAFAVVPRRPGIAVLRFCLYFEQNVIQSFRLAATCRAAEAPIRAPDQAALANALGLQPEDVGDAGYLARLEYSLVSSAEAIGVQGPRTLSIVVNDLDGQPWITVKGKDHFEVNTESNLPDLVQDTRDALDRVSVGAREDQDPAPMPYWFGSDPNINVGSPGQLDQAMQALAAAGWRLFARIIDTEKAEQIGRELEGERATIHVAHVLRPKVIPWTCVYDRSYDKDRKVEDGRQVGHATCRAPLLPADQGPATSCGTHTDCLLSQPAKAKWEATEGKVLREDTVACPLHLWGFQHVIEVPPMQVGAGQDGQDLWTCILSTPPPQVRAGLNTSLVRAQQHVGEIESAVAEANPGGTVSWARDRDEVLDGLDDPEVDIVYLYCHAQGGAAGRQHGIRHPVLLFAGLDGAVGRIEPEQFAGIRPEWTHRPLVFLNGCRTAGFSPDALSPFIETLVRDRKAAGVVGTEVSVWEQVATEVAVRFLKHFLRGTPAGEALLEARRGLLLEKNNPLGLAYVLYAGADLALDIDGDGACGPRDPGQPTGVPRR